VSHSSLFEEVRNYHERLICGISSPQGSPTVLPQAPQTAPSFWSIGLLLAQVPLNSPPFTNRIRRQNKNNANRMTPVVTNSNFIIGFLKNIPNIIL
jgi:hypothetical protein